MGFRDFVKKNWNVPNALTLLRLLLVPVYVALFARGLKYWALAVFVIASLTDLLDGMIARRCHLITDLGKLMDPLADKLMVLTVMFSMAIGNALIPAVIPWAAVIILLAKECFMMLGGLLMLKRNIVVYSYFIGKAAHCLFIGALVLSFFHDRFLALDVQWPALLGQTLTPDIILLWVAVACTLCAMVFYIVDSVRKVNAKRHTDA